MEIYNTQCYLSRLKTQVFLKYSDILIISSLLSSHLCSFMNCAMHYTLELGPAWTPSLRSLSSWQKRVENITVYGIGTKLSGKRFL